jgi:hypothetical protein
MVWPDNGQVQDDPPSTELDPSMKTQTAGIFVTLRQNVKHLIRCKDGQTISEHDVGKTR